ncbi:SurA N-terminal domain-containing protein [Halioxenophilus sp. WMMB6]|uniref:SurA N-terminal domain-containing protein n=1 Tax=Halioxenophilus sp. WMMB6 TaxID=3073815 RepID=UPI00295E2666|nr:SurA N-terminal domain-containing protein [Halioxenophilus sp. WMMB6]
MLQTFRDNLKGTVAVFLVVLICIPLVIFGIDSLFNTNPNTQAVAEVNGEPISQVDLARAIELQRRQLMAQFGSSLPPEFLSDERLRGPVLQSLIQRAALLQAADNGGMVAAQATLDQIVVNSSDFQVGGKFDSQLYQQVLRSAGFTHQTYQDLIGAEVLLNQYAIGVGQSNFALPNEVHLVSALGLQTRDFEYVSLDPNSVADQVTVTEEQLQQYYDQHQDSYLKPEMVTLEAVELDAEYLAESVSVSDEQIKEQYDRAVKDFKSTTQRRAAHILFDTSSDDYEQRLADVQKKLAEGEDFSELAKQYSDDFGSRETGGDVGYSSGEQFVPEFEQALAQLQVGQVSEPIKTDYGIHLIKLVDVSESSMPTLDEMRLSLIEKIKSEEADRIFLEKKSDFEDLTYNVSDLQPAATELGLSVETVGPSSRATAIGILANPQVNEAAFSDELIESGRSSDVIEIDPLHLVVFRVVQHQAESVKPFSEVRDQVTLAVTEDLATVLLDERVQSALQSLKAGTSLADVASSFGVEINASLGTKRQQPSLDSGLVEHLFAMPKPRAGRVFDSVEMSDGKIAIVSLSAVNSADLNNISEANQSAVNVQLTQLLGNSDLANVRKFVVDSAEVTNE